MRLALLIAACALLAPATARAGKLPTGYLVWVKGKQGDMSSRKVYRLTLPGLTDEQALTSGEDVSCQVSPDGKWVAYAKAKLAGGTDYHHFHLWKLYVVSIHGVGQGRTEIKIDDSGFWPSWGSKGELYYNQVDSSDSKHTKIIRVTLDEYGAVKGKAETVFSTKSAFSSFKEINECFMAPDGSWFAARTRGSTAVNGVGAYTLKPAKHYQLAKAGSVGCMPYVAPSSSWGLIAGADQGIRWGDAPTVSGRQVDQVLIPAKAGGRVYHPGISTDEKWVMAAHSTDQDHNAGPYDIYIYELEAKTRKASNEQVLVKGAFNGWPHVWVGQPGPPPPPKPRITEFYPASYTLLTGEKTTLKWVTRDTETAELDGAAVATEGSQEVTPSATTTYTLVAKNSKVSDVAKAQCTVTVLSSAKDVTIDSFSAKPATIEQGESATLSWKVSYPTTIDVDGTRAAPTGTLEVEPMKTTTYKLTAKGHNGPVTKEVTVTVKEVEKYKPPYYDDRGGFVCALAARPPWPGIGLLLLALLLVLRRRKRR